MAASDTGGADTTSAALKEHALALAGTLFITIPASPAELVTAAGGDDDVVAGVVAVAALFPEQWRCIDATLQRLHRGASAADIISTYHAAVGLKWDRCAHAVVLWWVGAEMVGSEAATAVSPPEPFTALKQHLHTALAHTKGTQWDAAQWAAQFGAWPLLAGLLGTSAGAVAGGDSAAPVGPPPSAHQPMYHIPGPGSTAAADAMEALLAPLRDITPAESFFVREKECDIHSPTKEDLAFLSPPQPSVPSGAAAAAATEPPPTPQGTSPDVGLAVAPTDGRFQVARYMAWNRQAHLSRERLLEGAISEICVRGVGYGGLTWGPDTPWGTVTFGLLVQAVFCGDGDAAAWSCETLLTAEHQDLPDYLSVASFLGQVETVQAAVAAGCPLPENALHMAALGGHVPLLQWLLQGPPAVNVDALCDGMLPAITFAAAAGQAEAVRFLIEAGADLGYIYQGLGDGSFETAAHKAVAAGYVDIAGAILEAGGTLVADYSAQHSDEQHAVRAAATAFPFRPSVMQWACQHAGPNAPQEYDVNSAWSYAVRSWNIAEILAAKRLGLLQDPAVQADAVAQVGAADPNNIRILWAAGFNTRPVLKANPTWGSAVLATAAAGGDVGLLEELVADHQPTQAAITGLLATAVGAQKLGTARWLLEHGADPSPPPTTHPSGYGYESLLAQVGWLSVPFIDLLVEFGANVEHASMGPRTVLTHCLVQCYNPVMNPDAIRRLIHHGANLRVAISLLNPGNTAEAKGLTWLREQGLMPADPPAYRSLPLAPAPAQGWVAALGSALGFGQ